MAGPVGDGFGFGPDARLRRRREFLSVQGSGDRRFTRHFIVYVRASSSDERAGEGIRARVGITASRKVGNAVVRNRWKRLVREVFRHLRPELGAVAVVVICRPGRDIPSLEEVRRQLYGALRGRGADRRDGHRPSRR